MAPDRRSRRGRFLRWGLPRIRLYRHNIEDTIQGESVRRVLDSYCPYCATDLRSVGPRRLVRCPNTAICGKTLPIDENCCPNCCHYTRAIDNFCRVCRTNLRSVVRGRGGLYHQLNRAPSPVVLEQRPEEENDEEETEEVEVHEPVVVVQPYLIPRDVIQMGIPPVAGRD